MKFRSIFEVIGPVMIGPSSSHTAGVVRIGKIARSIFGCQPQDVVVHFFGSFAETYRGHASDVAIIGGILDFDTDDPRIVDSISIADEWGITVNFFKETESVANPNTLKLVLRAGDKQMTLTGVSVGGGLVQIIDIDGFTINITGENPALLIFHQDVYGTVSAVTGVLASHKINISSMELSRQEKGQIALMVIETDQKVEKSVRQEIVARDNIHRVVQLGD